MTRPILLILQQRASQPRQLPVVNQGDHWVRLLSGRVLFGRADRVDDYIARASDPIAARSEFTEEFGHGIRRGTVYSTVCPDGEWGATPLRAILQTITEAEFDLARAYRWDADAMISAGALDVDAFGATCLIFRRAANARPMSTPWGAAQSTATFCVGRVMRVTTSSHGGFLVDRAWATEHLSPAAQRVGRPFARWLAYEEDCDARVVELEVDEIGWCLPEELIEELRRYHAAYLLERAITPDAFGGAELIAQLSFSELLGDSR